MKISYNIIGILVAFLCLISCNERNVSDLQLDGDCLVTSFAVDGYEGDIDKSNKNIIVRLPENYNLTELEVTSLGLSAGADCTIDNSDVLNLSVPRTMRVTNGDVFMDWTIIVRLDEAKIKWFKINNLYTGIIDEEEKTIKVFVPKSLDLKSLTATMLVSDDAIVSPESGIPVDFTSPVTYTVTNNTAQNAYVVTVIPIGKPSALFVGLVPSMDDLNPEEKTACAWMLENIANSLYVSFDDLINNTVDLDECKVIWWHFHKDGGVDGKDAFKIAAPQAVAASVKLRDYYQSGGSFFLTRYATNLPAFLGAVLNDACPNNCWGQFEADAETCGGPWSFSIAGNTDHPLFQNLMMANGEPENVYTTDAGYRITNSTAQWHIGTDWGGYDDYDSWRSLTGGIDLARGGDGAIVAWEFPAVNGKGAVLCIGSGCYDWYSIAEVSAGTYHDNIASMTLNAFNYLYEK